MMASVSDGSDERPAVTLFWRIKNFSYWEPNLHDTVITSPAFRVVSLDESIWYLKLSPTGKHRNDKHMSLNLLLYHKECGYPLDCEWSFLDPDGLPLVTGSLTNDNIGRYMTRNLPVCPTHEDVFVTRRSSFLTRDSLTIRCRLWKTGDDFEQAEHISAVTRINVEKCYFTWPIRGFSNFHVGKKMTTPLHLNFVHGLEVLQMGFSLTGNSLEDSAVEVEVTASFIQGLVMTIKVSALDREQKPTRSEEENHRFCHSNSEQKWIFSKLLSRKELIENLSDCLNNDVLTLLCEFTYCEGSFYKAIKQTSYGPSNPKEDITKNASVISEASCNTSQNRSDISENSLSRNTDFSLSALQDDLIFLYQEQTFSDFELVAGNVSFPVHKNVLSARSPVFRAMFSSDMKESDSNSLEVPDLDSHTLGRLLTFLYAGTVDDIQWEGAAKLYYAADKYQISTLKQECSSVLRSEIKVSNVSDILALADRHQDEELMPFVHDFILSRFAEVMASEEWKKFMDMDPVLAGKTTLELCIKRF